MAKGLGAILAQGKMISYRANTKGSVDCPLCGHPMELEMGGWFCRSEREPRHGHTRPCIFGREREMKDAFLDDPTAEERRWADDWQGATIAGIVEGGRVVVELHTIRGGGGRTNLRLSSDLPDRDLPEYCAGKEWTWMDWAYQFSVEAK